MSLEDVEADLSSAVSLIRTGRHDEAEPRVASAVELLREYRKKKKRPHRELPQVPSNGLSQSELLEQSLLLRACTLRAEIADYRDERDNVLEALRPFVKLIPHLENRRQEPRTHFRLPEDSIEWKLLRQELYYAIQCAVREYRDGRIGQSRRIVDTAMYIARAMHPESGGLLTQLYYAQAKSRLRSRDFLGATVQFRNSLVSAGTRVENAKPSDDVERQAAQYSVAKALVGLAQCLLDQGRMEEARTVAVAGRMLLDLTHDVIHRAYARQLLGSIERSSARDSDKKLLASAKDHLQGSLDVFDAVKPSAAFRSRYELGLIDLHLDKLASARKRLRAMLTQAENIGSNKWMASAHIGLSRVARKAKDYRSAVEHAEIARRLAADKKLETLEIKAGTAYVQALFEQYATQPDALGAVEDAIQTLLRKKVGERDARSRVVILLVQVRALAGAGNLRRARATFEEYERIADLVQSPRIHDLAKLALQAISTDSFLCPADKVEPDYRLKKNMKAVHDYVLRKATANIEGIEERADELEIGVSTYYSHWKRLEQD
jgi:tetratricopeptide (TPR) repeat protein